MSKDIEAAYKDIAIKEEAWEEARAYFKQLFLDFWDEFQEISKDDIEGLFEPPENESELLYRAALSRGQP